MKKFCQAALYQFDYPPAEPHLDIYERVLTNGIRSVRSDHSYERGSRNLRSLDLIRSLFPCDIMRSLLPRVLVSEIDICSFAMEVESQLPSLYPKVNRC